MLSDTGAFVNTYTCHGPWLTRLRPFAVWKDINHVTSANGTAYMLVELGPMPKRSMLLGSTGVIDNKVVLQWYTTSLQPHFINLHSRIVFCLMCLRN